MDPEVLQRIRVYAIPFSNRTETLGICCDGCPTRWYAEAEDFSRLAELVQRATEHAEVCK